MWYSILFFFLFILNAVLAQNFPVEKLLEKMVLETKNSKNFTHLPDYKKLKDMGQEGILQLVSVAKKKTSLLSSRIMACRLLDSLGTPEAVETLLPLVKDRKEEYSIRRQILQTAAVLNSPGTIPFILGIIQGKETMDIPVGHIIGGVKLSERSPFFAKLTGEILACFQDKDPGIRQKAASIFVAWQNPKASSALLELAKDASPEVRATAVWALASQKKQNHSDAILKAMNDPSSIVRERVLCVLAYPEYSNKIAFQKILNIYQKESSLFQSFWEKYKALENNPKTSQDKQWQRWNMDRQETRKLLGEQRVLLTTMLSLLARFLDKKESLEILLSFLSVEDSILASHAWSIVSSQGQELSKNKEMKRKILLSVVGYMKKTKNLTRKDIFCSFLEKISGYKIGNSPDSWIQWWEKEGTFLFP